MGDVPEMVLKVAKALAPQAWATLAGEDAQHFVVARRFSVENARIAIEAIREPTDEMRLAAYEAVERDDRWDIADDVRWAKSFTAAIDAALASQGNGRER